MRTTIRDNYTPELGQYHEQILVDPTRRKTWLFDCDGVFTDITKVTVVSERGDSEEYAASQKWLTLELEALEAADETLQDNIDAEAETREADDKTLQDNIDNEEADRIAADTEIWDEIEAIEAASDVVDIVGTYAELENYDTSALQDNDIIKVLQDETHDDAIAYYRWNATDEAFTFVGVEGPYYTASETDTLLAGKVDKTDVTSTPSFIPMQASETLVMSQKGVAKQVLNETNGGIQISSTAGNAVANDAAAIAIGPNAETGQSSATAVGYNAKALGGNGSALGYNSSASGAYSISIAAENSKAAGTRDIAIGRCSTEVDSEVTQTNCNLVIGAPSGPNNNDIPRATGGISTAIGHGSVLASGGASTAIGYGSITASGGASIAMGVNSVVAAGNNDIAIGGNGTTTQVSSGTQTAGNLAVGLGARADGGNSAAFGSASATGVSSTAIGRNNITASGAGSTALGFSTVTAAGANDVAVGSRTVTTTVNSGTTQTGNNVAIGTGGVVANGGNSVAVGASGITSNGSYSTAIGTSGVLTYDSYNVAIGTSGATAGDVRPAVSSSFNFAFGGQSVTANGGNSVAIGTMGTTASAARTVALGHRSCTASHADSVALGTDAATSRTFEVSLGKNAVGSTPEVTKYIAHVTAGVNNTDAVNVAQLNAAIPSAMTGATSSTAGTSGLVPAPAAGDDTKVLRGDGTWGTVTTNALLIKEWS